MKKHRSITAMTITTLLICAVMYGVAAQEDMTEEKLAAEMTLAMEQDRESATLAAALFEESYRRARVEVQP